MSETPIRLGLALQPSNALALVAADQQCFKEEGLRVQLIEFVSGKHAMAAMLRGEVDAATTSIEPFVLAAFERPQVRALAVTASYPSVASIVARRDRGVAAPKDLAGKRIATQRGSAVHYFLDAFLDAHKISRDGLTVSFMAAQDLPAALANGQIDAFSMREPYVSQARDLLGHSLIVFPGSELSRRYELIVTTDATIQGRRPAANALVRALKRAEAFAEKFPERTIQIVADRLDVRESALSGFWPEVGLAVQPPSQALTLAADRAEWAIRAGIRDGKDQPHWPVVLSFDYEPNDGAAARATGFVR